MKIQLDTTSKTIKTEEPINLNELFTFLEKTFPNGEWRDFKFECHTVVNWQPAPIIVNPWTPAYPWQQQPWITYTDNSNIGFGEVPSTYCLNSGIFDIEINTSKINSENLNP